MMINHALGQKKAAENHNFIIYFDIEKPGFLILIQISKNAVKLNCHVCEICHFYFILVSLLILLGNPIPMTYPVSPI